MRTSELNEPVHNNGKCFSIILFYRSIAFENIIQLRGRSLGRYNMVFFIHVRNEKKREESMLLLSN